MPSYAKAVVPMWKGLRAMAQARGELPSISALCKAIAGTEASRGARQLVRRMRVAGYLVMRNHVWSEQDCMGIPVVLTAQGWRAYRRNLWRDPTVMDVGLSPDD